MKNGLLSTFGNNLDKIQVKMECDHQMKKWIKDFDRKWKPHDSVPLEVEVIVSSDVIVETDLGQIVEAIQETKSFAATNSISEPKSEAAESNMETSFVA